jgi:hypothetical protein
LTKRRLGPALGAILPNRDGTYWRALAEQTRSNAKRALFPNVRDGLAKIAMQYEELARMAEQREARAHRAESPLPDSADRPK